MRGGVPGRGALGADRFDHVFEVLGDRDPLVGFRLGGHLEHVGEDIFLRVVIDDGDPALLEAVDGAKIRLIFRHRACSSIERSALRLFAMPT